MSLGSPMETVGMVISWLNSTFHLNLPVKPPAFWPGFMHRLWEMFVKPPLPEPTDPLPWSIEVEGNFDGLLPADSTAKVKAQIRVTRRIVPSPPE